MLTRRARPARAEVDEATLGLLARHGAQILATARRYAATPEDAEDAYQRGLEILLTKAPTTSEDDLVPWLKTVVKHEAFALRRHRERNAPITDDGELGERGTPAAATHDQAERYERLRQGAEALRQLKPQEIRALLLKGEGYSYAEICEITGWSYTKVNRCLTEGRRALAVRLAGIQGGIECAKLAPLLSALVDGEASAEQLALLRPHMRTCLACRATLREFRAAPERVAALVPPGALAAAAGEAARCATCWSRSSVPRSTRRPCSASARRRRLSSPPDRRSPRWRRRRPRWRAAARRWTSSPATRGRRSRPRRPSRSRRSRSRRRWRSIPRRRRRRPVAPVARTAAPGERAGTGAGTRSRSRAGTRSGAAAATASTAARPGERVHSHRGARAHPGGAPASPRPRAATRPGAGAAGRRWRRRQQRVRALTRAIRVTADSARPPDTRQHPMSGQAAAATAGRGAASHPPARGGATSSVRRLCAVSGGRRSDGGPSTALAVPQPRRPQPPR